jgi:hypothetical protein
MGRTPECVAAPIVVSSDQMTAVATKVPAWADHDVAELAPMLTVRQVQRLLGTTYRHHEPDSPNPPSPNPTAPEPSITEPDAPSRHRRCPGRRRR